MNWDDKFSGEEYSYGTEPNDFLRAVAGRIEPGGAVLSLCEGEGRNGVFLAALGFDVLGVDGSVNGLEKARRLAAARGVELRTELCDLNDYAIAEGKWDAIVSIFGHLPANLRKKINAAIVKGLKPGGVLILEGYTPRQLRYATGGPKDVAMLYEPEELERELAGLDFEIVREIERDIVEGPSHTGKGAVVQILARRKS